MLFSDFRSRLQKLPDKGLKIQALHDRAVKALELKNEIESAANLLSSLNLGSNDINNLEWTGSTKTTKQQDVLDSDDDEDPLAILTSSNSVNKNKRIVKHSKADEQLITEEDLKEAAEITKSPLHLDPVLEHVCQNENMEQSQRFLPHKPKFKSPSSSTSSLASENEIKKHRDNSAATPPVHQGAKQLTLRESIETEHLHRLKMQELQEKQAAERLAMKTKELGSIELQPPQDAATKNPDANFMSKYRVASSFIDEFDENDDRLSDEADYDED